MICLLNIIIEKAPELPEILICLQELFSRKEEMENKGSLFKLEYEKILEIIGQDKMKDIPNKKKPSEERNLINKN